MAIDEAEGRVFRRILEVGAQTRTFCATNFHDVGLARSRGMEEFIHLRSGANLCFAAHAAHAAGAVGAEIGRVLHSTILNRG